ncbi:hypothetical protein [Humibacter ginsenosidimutans]|uniref:hypothetical protein n=1 Tax=Humibacter ginsenosidimutans TaxID=2599293 RepID=UPI00143D3F1D|nr:hypothetical protein [Humibacter ginsenosidimutans]
MFTAQCTECGQPMTLSVKPEQRRPKQAPGRDRTDFDEWFCPNGHRRNLTRVESRAFD